MGHPMALPAGLDELWGFTSPSRDAARAVQELINFDAGAVTEAAVEARHGRDHGDLVAVDAEAFGVDAVG